MEKISKSKKKKQKTSLVVGSALNYQIANKYIAFDTT